MNLLKRNKMREGTTIKKRLYWLFHGQYTLVEVRRGETRSRVTTIYDNRRLAVNIARASNATHYMLYRRTSYGEMGKLIMEGHSYDDEAEQ